MEPAASQVLSKGTAGGHKIQGIGAGFVPDTLDTKIYNEVVDIENEEASEFARLFGTNEGFLAGISSGAALAASVKLALRKENENKSIVMVLPDTGKRFLSTAIFEE